MKKNYFSLLGCAVLTLAFAAPAYAVEAQTLQISKLGDTDLTCADLSKEAMMMRDIINTTEEIKDDSQMQDRGVTAAGAVGSFLIGTVTGGIGLAAAGFMASQQIEAKSENADNVQDIAEQRRSFMIGIYNAKGCEGPIEQAMMPAPVAENPGIAKQMNTLETAAGHTQPQTDTETSGLRAVDKNSDTHSKTPPARNKFDPQAAAEAAAQLKRKTYNN